MSAATYRLLNLLLLGALLAGSMMVYPSLPERFPTHFDAAGRPDAWAERSLLSWLALPLVSAGTAVLLEVASRLSARHPQLWNVPHKQRFLALTPEERAPIVRRLQEFMGLVAAASTVLMGVVQAAIYHAATRPVIPAPLLVLPATLVHVTLLLVAALRLNRRIGTLIQDAERRRATAA